MSELEYRSPTPGEVPEFFAVPLHAYGMDATAAEINHEVLVYEDGRSIGAKDGDEWVGGSGAFTLELTVPGGAQVAAAGITMIGVSPTHRRRGILTTMMRHLHDDAVRRGEIMAVLTASEASIYRRFGYGVATESTHLSIPAEAIDFDPPLEGCGGFHMVDPHVDTADISAVYERVCRVRPGWFTMSQAWWAKVSDDPLSGRNGATKLFGVVHVDCDGIADGYALWRIKESITASRRADNTVIIIGLVGETAKVELTLWQFLASIDLATTLTWDTAPVDQPMRWRVIEPRRIHTTRRADWMWARLLDVPAALVARSYGTTGELTLSVTDTFRPESGGVFRLDVTSQGANCTKLDPADHGGTFDIELAMPELSAIFFGGVAPSLLAEAGRVTETRPGSVALADALFVTNPPPSCPIEF